MLRLYVNRIDAQGGSGIQTVTDLHQLLKMHAPQAKVLAASFKTPRQALDCLLAGCRINYAATGCGTTDD